MTTAVLRLGFLVSAVVLSFSALQAQAPLTTPHCYRLDVGPWQPSLAPNAAFHRIPPVIRLDTLFWEHGARRVEPPMSYPFHGEMPRTPYWKASGDTVRLVWSDGFNPTVLKLVRRRDDLVGEAVAESDYRPSPEPPLPRATVTAHSLSCPEGDLRPAR
jgi:hypothetical protein